MYILFYDLQTVMFPRHHSSHRNVCNYCQIANMWLPVFTQELQIQCDL